MRVGYVSAPCGSGKTHLIIEEAHELLKLHQNVVIAQPTSVLIEETAASFRERFPDDAVTAIHGTNAVASARDRILSPSEPGVIVMTHAALWHLQNVGATDWRLFIDEVPQAHQHLSKRFRVTHEKLSEHLEVVDRVGNYEVVAPTNAEHFVEIARNEHKDDGLEPFRELSSLMRSEAAHEIFMRAGELDEVTNGTLGTFEAFALLRPDVLQNFRNPTIFSAFFEDSLLKKVWERRYGVEFIQMKRMSGKLRFQTHGNGRRLTIEYALERHRFSKHLRDANGSLLLEVCRRALEDHSEQVLWLANKDVSDTMIDPSRGIRLPHVPHGLNTYQHVHRVLLLAALNLPPAHQKFLREIGGLQDDEIANGVGLQRFYQTTMRCSLRDISCDRPVVVTVTDRRTAESLADMFPGSLVRRLEGIEQPEEKMRGRRRKHVAGSDRTAAWREKKRSDARELIDFLGMQRRSYGSELPKGGVLRDETIFKEDDIVTEKMIADFSAPSASEEPYILSVFDNKYSSGAFETLNMSISKLETFLEEAAEESYPTKTENFLISGSRFNPLRDPNRPRSAQAVVDTRLFFIDMDKGNLLPRDFAKLFPEARMTIYASHSSTKASRRYRAIIPLSAPVSAHIYKLLFGWFKERIKSGCERLGKVYGLDEGASSAASIFYAPCVPAEPEAQFFRVYVRGRSVFDVRAWANEMLRAVEVAEPKMVAEPKTPSKASVSSVTLPEIQDAVERWRASASIPGEGNAAFFRLGLESARAGLSPEEVEARLAAEVIYARHPEQRVRQISSILDSLAIYGSFDGRPRG